MEQNYIIKISGTAYLPEPLVLGDDYVVAVRGGVVSETKEPNENGSQDTTFKLRLITLEVADNKGKTMFSVDRRSRSKQIRACIWHYWDTEWREKIPDFEEFYDKFQAKYLANFEATVEFLKSIK